MTFFSSVKNVGDNIVHKTRENAISVKGTVNDIHSEVKDLTDISVLDFNIHPSIISVNIDIDSTNCGTDEVMDSY